MIIAIVLLTSALLVLAVYAATLRARLQNAKEEATRLRSDDERFKTMASQVIEESRRSLSRETIEQMATIRQDLASFNSTLDSKLTTEASERGALREKIEARLKSEDERFQALATKVLDDSRRSLSRDTAEQMQSLLSPLRQQIATFNSSIDEKLSREASERGALREKIEELHKLNITLGKEAKQLTEALKGQSKIQGDWGEMILSRLLEQAGFTEGREFDVQKNIKDDNGSNLRPDVVLHYPDRGCLVIDSKASLTAYINLCSAENEEERNSAGAAHIASVRAHVKELATKKYQDLVGTDCKLDFVMMFIPNEGAYISAMQLAPELWQEAYDRRVLIVSPTHLFSVLKLIQQMWLHDDQTRNATKIAEEAGKMYDKFVGFLSDMSAVETKLNQALDAHGLAMKKLSDGTGNLIKRAEDLRKLGAKVNKSIEK